MKNAVFIVVFMLLARPVMPVLEYILNYDYIVKELCVNKAKPQMHCNGKCHLMKELAKAAEKEKPASDKKVATQQAEVLFLTSTTNYTFKALPVIFTQKNSVGYHNLYTSLISVAVFRPPVNV
ncbi:hypothetical protein [Flavobacterium subsaxonicum]|uniref:hypothetical protein n=1 Tax=Flavobacterium subsaxonicum TaxID=426226 RepID=UPI00047E35D5|nr:hypothetical protein [Flavobacterium subsaxonicum]